MYTKKCVAFIDILGFGDLVEESDNNPDVARNIYNALMSMSAEALKESVEPELNENNVEDGGLEEAQQVIDRFKDKLKKMYSLEISYFSDCVVLSADAGNSMSCQMLFDTIGKFALRLWGKNNLVMRGGVSIGSLHHTENGPVFGPAMNRAYVIESKEAVNPRLLVDRDCYEHISKSRSFDSIKTMFVLENGEIYCSLPSYYKHYKFDPTVHWNGLGLEPTLDSLKALVNVKIGQLSAQGAPEKVLSKYHWLISQSGKN
ncbi:hypothetical protein WOB89_22480 [Vibrio parahaemolyticus]|uniref:hypothetical protein n=1 Tax=Vibrio parahaemolyticus TaxID=670 RepID=UPI000A3C8C84|nr:hypothetical protein [Vibrio parahaemolyticus]OUJ33750.1 hypothetical protein BTR40_23920 [Vibrio parahaemolyticus]